jgi:DNA-binding GntR family transcriptional regulator
MPGEHLNEKQICKRFGVSRTPVREAMKILAGEYLVTIVPNSGVKVAEMSYEDISNMYDLLAILDGGAARLACLSVTSNDIIKLEECEFQLERSASENNVELAYELNVQFHIILVELSKNRYLIETRKNITVLSTRFVHYSRFIASQIQATISDHNQIIDALKKRNAGLSEFLTKKHTEDAKGRMLNYYKEIQNKHTKKKK